MRLEFRCPGFVLAGQGSTTVGQSCLLCMHACEAAVSQGQMVLCCQDLSVSWELSSKIDQQRLTDSQEPATATVDCKEAPEHGRQHKNVQHLHKTRFCEAEAAGASAVPQTNR